MGQNKENHFYQGRSIMVTHQVVARNYSEASENRIHNDDVAKKYGFQGALVPGVAVYGYLTHPLVERFGERWLSGSVSSVRFLKPAYEGDALSISAEEQGAKHHVRCVNASGVLLAELVSEMPETLPEPYDQTVFGPESKPAERLVMDWDSVVPGQPFLPWHWQITEDGNRMYADRVDDKLLTYRTAAHPHWLLGIANYALVREYIMPAWVHVGSEIRFRALLKVGDTVQVQAVPLEKWERKGHQFVKLYLAYHRDSVLATEIIHTAIFRLAE
jgi:acyl dehydratase